MSNFDRAVKALNDVGEYIDYLEGNIAYVTALQAAGLLAPDAQVIRTPEELEALDPDTCTLDKFGDFDFAKAWIDENGKMFVGHVDFLPAVVFATGDQVRAAREAMEATCTTHKN